ncbi:uncharacterized protein [Haliotis cracherodii]|uniref:uncharacterized protein LOC125372315 n=1 Tax=Haliotis rufescens TaxID=6454 RepID=UPI00201F31A7|nr:uncharacterized protein LOC125372315 [Haliotis rufescens]
MDSPQQENLDSVEELHIPGQPNKAQDSVEGLADRSTAGWAVVSELEGDELASNSDEERRFERAESKAQRRKRPTSFNSRGRGYSPYPSATFPNPNSELPKQAPQVQQNQPFRFQPRKTPLPNQQCYFCGAFGHWRATCPLAAAQRSSQSSNFNPPQGLQPTEACKKQ